MDLNNPPGSENQMSQDPNGGDAFFDPRQDHLHDNYSYGSNENYTYSYYHPGVNNNDSNNYNNYNHNSHYDHQPNHNYQRPPNADVGTGQTNLERQTNFERQMIPPGPRISPEFSPTLSSSTGASLPTASNVPVDSSATRKRKRTREEIEAADALAAAKRTARNIKAAHKRAETLKKQADRAAQKAARDEAAAATTPRFIWTDEQTVELLRFVQLVKDDFDELEERTPGFLVWTTFFKANTLDREEYPLLVGMANDKILRRYRALMTTWKVVYDKLSHSGSAGLHEVLAQEKLAESAWNMLNEMHQTNPGAHAYGHTELHERLEELVGDLGHQSDSADDEEAVLPTPRRRRGEAGLTAAELALDDDVDDDLPSGDVNLATNRPSLATPRISQTSTATPTRAARANNAATPASQVHSSATQATPTNLVGQDTRPPKGVDPPSRRRGRTELVKPDDSTSTTLLMMMQKSQERQEQQRLDERALASEQAVAKQAKLLMEQQDREERAKERADERRAREEDRKEERREAQLLRTQETVRAEAAQERMRAERLADEATRRADEESRRLFQTAMMKLLAGMTK
ncbi:hypothetical protein Pst134EA_013809 [Puccinia striiformis f. sp. tritici]|uniref:hypothetical protein n=1 Tax=Puccinia striiformis f. sp. tritici TaxID=168172 RepID=UPI0020085D30|nr:hypothetical protein Pst134EA_013809 [Puccinia striiformis f. sp. tritici]KAH9465955.1 hypothetical protein Pst134EA_013809 [Puccinia striiformis f. sp. tritici]KAI9604192.1 hypothetical protein H4Q26_003805 [Puccinia striiformis f. sp. tritici PST-130]